MSYEFPGGLPTLAHPLIAMPTMDAKNNEPGIYLPPYPGVNLNWKGFSIAHLHWVGFKQTRQQMTDLDLQLYFHHELCHSTLAYLPLTFTNRLRCFSCMS
jgi:hypothetical protein